MCALTSKQGLWQARHASEYHLTSHVTVFVFGLALYLVCVNCLAQHWGWEPSATWSTSYPLLWLGALLSTGGKGPVADASHNFTTAFCLCLLPSRFAFACCPSALNFCLLPFDSCLWSFAFCRYLCPFAFRILALACGHGCFWLCLPL